MNTVIQAAGILKKNEPQMEEDLQMLRAMRDSNLPKFLRDDILLFRAIIKDLFPGVVEPVAFYEGLERELATVTAEHGLQASVYAWRGVRQRDDSCWRMMMTYTSL